MYNDEELEFELQPIQKREYDFKGNKLKVGDIIPADLPLNYGVRGENGKYRPFNSVYVTDTGIMYWFINETTAFGFTSKGHWRGFESGHISLKADFWKPIEDIEEWNRAILEYAESKYDVKQEAFQFQEDGSLWLFSNIVLDIKTGKWHEEEA